MTFACSIALLDGRAGEAEFSDAAVVRADVRDLMARIEVVPDADVPHTQAGATALTDDGETVETWVDHARGTPGNRLTDDELRDKFHGLADGVLGRDRAERLADAAFALQRRRRRRGDAGAHHAVGALTTEPSQSTRTTVPVSSAASAKARRATCRSDLGPAPVQLGTFGIDARRHGVDRHPVVPQRRRKCQRESEQPVLGRREVHPLGVAGQCVAAEDVDDPSTRDERRQRAPDAAKCAIEGDRTDLMPVVLGDRLDALPRTVRGVVDEDPQRAVVGDGLEHAPHRRWIGDVGGDGERAAASGANRRGHRVGLLGARPRVHRDRKSFARKPFGDDRTQTAARAGDQGDVSHRQPGRSAPAAPRRREARRPASRWPAAVRRAPRPALGRPVRGTSR